MIDYKSLSLANQVYQQIERNILNGTYETGSVISETKLSEELGVSRTPIRQAITRLENERLIGVTPMGSIVLGITDKDVEDMFCVKRFLEPVVTRMAAENISDEQIAQLKDALEQQEFYSKKSNVSKVRNLDTDFHDIIYMASGSPVFQSILSPIHHKLMKYREESLNMSERRKDSIHEHYELFNAIAARDSNKAEALIKEHLENAYTNIRKGRSK